MFHVNDNGDVNPCSASKGTCPFSPDRHFENIQEAHKHYENKMSHNTVKSNRKYVEIPTDLGNLKLRDGDLSDKNARFSLANGLCGDLAKAIVENTGRDVYFVCYDKDEKTLKEDFLKDKSSVLTNVTHVVVQSEKSGHFIDSYGQKSASDIENFYEGAKIIKGSPEMLNTFSTGVSDKMNNFAKEALSLDADSVSYDYNDMPGRFSEQSVRLSVLPKKGGSYFGSDVPYKAVEERLMAWRDHIGADVADKMEETKELRDGDYSFHITVISPPEMRKLERKKVFEAFSNNSPNFNIGGVGTVTDGEKEAWFIRAQSDEADKIRAELGLPPKDFHITIGFLNGDVFSQQKDESTVVLR